MLCLRSKFHINELIRILQTKFHGVLQFHDRYIGGPTTARKKKANKVLEGGLLYRRSVFKGEVHSKMALFFSFRQRKVYTKIGYSPKFQLPKRCQTI